MVYGLVFTGKRKGRITSEMRYGKDLFKTKAKAEKARKALDRTRYRKNYSSYSIKLRKARLH